MLEINATHTGSISPLPFPAAGGWIAFVGAKRFAKPHLVCNAYSSGVVLQW